jgi:hypothetical protein
MNKGDVAFISSEVNSLCDSFDEVRLLCLAKSDGVMITAPQIVQSSFLNPWQDKEIFRYNYLKSVLVKPRTVL